MNMTIVLMLFAFVVALILISISPLERWRLSPDDPLNVDNLKWSAAGYGSASVSLNCLFGAYSAMLLLIGYTCFAGVVTGVVSGLFMLNWWINRYDPYLKKPGFQSILYNLRVFESNVADRAFWFLLAFCQLGLAVAELVLLHHVFQVGLGFSAAYATVASLATSCVAYYYCLLGGYQAAFRSDALRYLFILLMGIAMLFLLWRVAPALGGIDSVLSATVADLGNPRHRFLEDHPYLRAVLEPLGGFALGILPIMSAPDAWKRVLVIAQKHPHHILSQSDQPRLLNAITHVWRLAPLRLLLAAALPFVLIMPLLVQFSDNAPENKWSFPIREIFILSTPLTDSFIILGMVAAFMSTFDGALLSATHVLLGQNVLPKLGRRTELARFRITLGLAFAVTFLPLISLVYLLPNPYAFSALLVPPFALVSGIITGTSFGARKAKPGIIYLIVPIIAGWSLFALRYLAEKNNAEDPYLAAPLVFFGCCVFFLMTIGVRILSARPS